ncbi:hypothetical protein BH23CHL5_BH23CHL5_03120 [soil metagenome]
MTSKRFTGFEQRIQRSLVSLSLTEGSRIGVAFSGGVDSLALALALKHVSSIIGVSQILLHVDHGMRSTSDLENCKALAESLDLDILHLQLELGIAKRSQGFGIEEQARRERYRALSKMAQLAGVSCVATGHHANDQAETVLLHLFRGSSLHGVAGMQERASVVIPWWNSSDLPQKIQLWRPLLREPRELLSKYVDLAGLAPVHDQTNDSLDFARNDMRHRILPAIEQSWPAAQKALGRFASSASDDDQFLSDLALKSLDIASEDHEGLNADALQLLDRAISTRVVYQWLRRNEVAEPTLERINAALHLAESRSQVAEVQAGNGMAIRCIGSILYAGSSAHLANVATSQSPDVAYMWPEDTMSVLLDDKGSNQTFTNPNWSLIVKVNEPGDFQTSSERDRHTPARMLRACVDIRTTRPGDRWHHSGRLVKESLRKANIHPVARPYVACATIGDRVASIGGISPTVHVVTVEGEHPCSLVFHWSIEEVAQ